MNLYDYRKQIQKLYDNSVYGNIKGDIYKELSELRIDNSFIIDITTDSMSKRVSFKLDNKAVDTDTADLIKQIQQVIKSFVIKNTNCMSDELKNFLESNLYFDTYIINSEESKIVMVQL